MMLPALVRLREMGILCQWCRQTPSQMELKMSLMSLSYVLSSGIVRMKAADALLL